MADFYSDLHFNVMLARSQEVDTLLVVLMKIRDMNGYFDLGPSVKTLETIYKSILSTIRSYTKRLGMKLEIRDDIDDDTPQSIWIREFNRVMQKMFRCFETRPRGSANELEIQHVLGFFCLLFDVPRDYDDQMTYVKLDDPGDIRHIFQENEIFIDQFVRIIYQLCSSVLGQRNIYIDTLIRKYNVVQNGVSESINAYITEKLAVEHKNKNPVQDKTENRPSLPSEGNMQRLLCQLSLSS
jgi:hypothetical protein